MPPGWPRRFGFQPCSPRCANRLRYGIQPKNARPGPGPRPVQEQGPPILITSAMPGRRVLASRKWSGKTLDDHRADRRDWLLKTLGVSATDPGPLRLGK